MRRFGSKARDDSDDDLSFWEHPLWAALVKTVLVLSILALGGGYLGWLHPAGDSLAVGRGIASAMVFVSAMLAISAGMRLAAFGAILLAAITGTSVALAYIWPGPPGSITLYQKNLRFDNADLAGMEADIRAANPMVVTLQEVSEANQTLLAALQDQWPHQQVCPFGGVGGPAVVSQLPAVPGATVCAPGLAAMQVVYQDTPIWIVSVHLHWPWPYDQARHAAELEPVLAGLEGPVLLGGDFNMVRWGRSVERLAAVAGVRPAGPMQGSYLGFAPWLTLPIDHVFAPRGGRVTYRPLLGSDHLGIFAVLEP
ncbi:MAG: hypothetical protein B7Y02_02175 [Rhodobacterales bacterium 17-64-5]|nr:MAG: hypothetical protein B7Y02_02175 [Rhodobacterales bacterium 17-64-5]